MLRRTSDAKSSHKRRLEFTPQDLINPDSGSFATANVVTKKHRSRGAPSQPKPRPGDMFPGDQDASFNFSFDRVEGDFASLLKYSSATGMVPQRRHKVPAAHQTVRDVDNATAWDTRTSSQVADVESVSVPKMLQLDNLHCGQHSNRMAAVLEGPPSSGLGSSGLPTHSHSADGGTNSLDVQRMLFWYRAQQLQWIHLNSLLDEAMKKQKKSADDQLARAAVAVCNLYSQVSNLKACAANHERVQVVDHLLNVQLPALEEWSHIEAESHEATASLVNALTACLTNVPLDELGEGIPSTHLDVQQFRGSLQAASNLLESLQETVSGISWLCCDKKLLPLAPDSRHCKTEEPGSGCEGGSSGLELAATEADNLLEKLEAEVESVEECWEMLQALQQKELRLSSLRSQIIQIGRANRNWFTKRQCDSHSARKDYLQRDLMDC